MKRVTQISVILLVLCIPLQLPAQDWEREVSRYVGILPYTFSSFDLPPELFSPLSAAIAAAIRESYPDRIIDQVDSSGDSESASILLIPTLEEAVVRDEGEKTLVELRSGFVLYDRRQEYRIARFSVPTIGIGESLAEALAQAVGDIPSGVLDGLSKVEEFRRWTGILSVDEGRLLLAFGRDMGLKPGDEFLLQKVHGEGLVRVDEVLDTVAFADLVYGEAAVGDRLIELPGRGLEVHVYMQGVFGSDLFAVPVIGTVLSIRRAGSDFHPLFGLELPLTAAIEPAGTQLFPYLGLQTTMNLRRWQFSPQGALGLGVLLPPDGEAPEVTHAGGIGRLVVSYRLTPGISFFLSGGYVYWAGTRNIAEEERYRYNGISVAGGVAWGL